MAEIVLKMMLKIIIRKNDKWTQILSIIMAKDEDVINNDDKDNIINNDDSTKVADNNIDDSEDDSKDINKNKLKM